MDKFLKIFWPIVLGLSVAAIISVFAFQTTSTAKLETKVGTYSLEIASTDELRERGLGGRSSLAANEGMIFVFDKPAVKCFWMKDMHFPIDIIWLDELKRAVHIETNVQPGTYPKQYCPNEKARYVIELKAGEAARSGIQAGQTLRV